MLSPLRRGALLTASALTASALALAGCGAGSSTAGSDAAAASAAPVTVTHAFGTTTIPATPERVATVSWVNADVALALGVVPVGMPKDEYGGNAQGSTPWKDTALAGLGAAIGSAKAPVQYSEADGINFAEIAKTAPDVILAAYSGLTKEDYDKLSKIAPVVAYPKVAYGTSWQESTLMIGKALGRDAQAEKIVNDVEGQLKTAATDNPQLAGKTFIYGNLEPASGKGVSIYTANDNRPRFLTSLGMTMAPVVAGQGGDAFFVEWSPERTDELTSDIFVTWVPEASTVAAIEKDPLLSQIPAVGTGALVADSDNTLTLSVSAASPLSVPWALEKFVPMLAAAADKADAAA